VIRLHDKRRGCARQECARKWHDAVSLGLPAGQGPCNGVIGNARDRHQRLARAPDRLQGLQRSDAVDARVEIGLAQFLAHRVWILERKPA